MNLTKRYVSIVLLFVLIFTSCVYFSGRDALAADKVDRIAEEGGDRYRTAINISREGWKGTSDNVVLTTGSSFPDALSAGPLAKKLDAPILLVKPSGLDGFLLQELTRLKPQRIIIVGGTSAVSREAELQLDEKFPEVKRIKGEDRYGTSLEVAKYMADEFGISGEMVIATGLDFPDALSISPVAAIKDMPILLSHPSSLPRGLTEFVKDCSIKKAYLIGGNNALGDGLLKGLPEGSERIRGANRFETNAKVQEKFKDVIDYTNVYVATGLKFPDALAGSALAAKTSSPLMLVGTSVPNEVMDILEKKYTSIEKIMLLGGEKVILPSVAEGLIPKFNTQGNTGGNTCGVNMGLAAEQGNWIYYNDGEEDASLYKIRKDGTGRTLLSKNDGAFINVVGQWVYYSNFSSNQDESGIYKVKIDGSGETRISGDTAWNMSVSGDWIYYTDLLEGGYIYKIKTDGSNKTKLSGSAASEMVLSDGWIYYVKYDAADGEMSGQIYKVKTDGTGEAKVSDDRAMYVNAVGDWIYYQNMNYNLDESGKIYRIRKDGTGRRKLNDDISMFLNVSGGWIYYGNYNGVDFDYPETLDGGRLYRMKTDGTGRVEISSHSPAFINVVGDWVYYGSMKDEKFYRVKTNGTFREAVK